MTEVTAKITQQRQMYATPATTMTDRAPHECGRQYRRHYNYQLYLMYTFSSLSHDRAGRINTKI